MPAVVRKTCAHDAIAKRPCLISISCQRRYLSGIRVIRPSGSYTPSGLVVPTSPGVMAAMRALDTAGRTTGALSESDETAVESMTVEGGRGMCEAQRGTGEDVGAQSGGAQFRVP